MRNESDWKPTKFVCGRHGRWRASRTEVPVTSRLIGDCIAATYHRAIETYARGRLADLGCGKVPLYGMYREKTTDIVCIDWQGSRHGSVHVDSFADLNTPLDLDPTSFDTVIATDVIEHLYAPATFLASAARILKPNGILIIGVPFLYWVHEPPHDYYRYTRFALERIIKEAGLSVVQLEPYGGPAEVLCDFATKVVGRNAVIALPIYWLTRVFLAVPPVKKLSGAKRETMPMGYVLVARKET